MNSSITSDFAPAAIGPYSQAVRAGSLLFTSGQLPADPATGGLETGIAAQTLRSLNNISAILAAAGLGIESVVKTTVFLSDMDDFADMNKVYAEFFAKSIDGGYALPARSTVEVSRLPKNALVEIEAVASLD